MSSKNQILSRIGPFFKDLFTKNIGLKFIALLFAFLLWAYVLTIENPEYTKVVRDVEITMTGESTLVDKGLMLVSREIGTTDVTVLCQIGKHSELDASRINCNVNLSDRAINLAEDEDSKVFPLTVTTTLQTGYGTITAVENSTVNVEIARVSTRNALPISIEYEGALPAGFQLVVPEKLTISVSGMKSLVEQIAKGVVTVDLSSFPIDNPDTLAGEYSNVYPVQFYDRSNVAVENIYNDNGESYTVEVPIIIRAYKEVGITPDIQIDDGYEYTASLSRNRVIIYGERNVLQTVSSLQTEPITALPEMEGAEIVSDLILPEGITLGVSDHGTLTVTLTVTEITDTQEISVPITYKGISKEVQRGEEFPAETVVRITGTLRELEKFSTAYVGLTADLSGYGPGTHIVPLVMTVDQRAGQMSVELAEPSVTVTLVEIPKETEQTEPVNDTGNAG